MLGSIAGKEAYSGGAIYCATKSALLLVFACRACWATQADHHAGFTGTPSRPSPVRSCVSSSTRLSACPRSARVWSRPSSRSFASVATRVRPTPLTRTSSPSSETTSPSKHTNPFWVTAQLATDSLLHFAGRFSGLRPVRFTSTVSRAGHHPPCCLSGRMLIVSVVFLVADVLVFPSHQASATTVHR